jgi:hypothetical protein
MTDRGDPHATHKLDTPVTPLRRRGILAAVATLAAGGLLQQTTKGVQAGTDGDLVLNTTNNATARTTLQVTPALSFPSSDLLTLDARPDTAGGTAALRAFGSNGGNLTFAAAGIITNGGLGIATAPGGGTGLVAQGGGGGAAGGGGASGVRGTGGNGAATNGPAGHGVEGFGGIGNGTGAHGIGVRGTGGGANGSQASGVVGQNNSTPDPAMLGANAGNGVGVYGNSAGNYGVFGTSGPSVGVYGNSSGGYGVFGTSANNVGVYGNGTTAYGVFGTSSNQAGVAGQSNSNAGVYGQSTSNYGTFGVSNSNVGAYGSSNTGYGVFGNSPANVGVYGNSSSSYGVFGFSTSGTGIVGQCGPGGRAGFFQGDVVVQGNHTVIGGSKSAAVPFGDGSYRRLYAVEAPESWFEDFGTGRLVDCRASVPIPADFAQTVNLSAEYFVFLTSRTAEVEALAVTVQAPDHFEVQANGKGQVTGTFSYRIVAKRKDIAGARLERVPAPSAADAAPPTVPAPLPALKDLPAPPPAPVPVVPAATPLEEPTKRQAR